MPVMSASVFSTLAEVAERWTPDTPFPYLESSFLRRRDHYGVLPIIDVSSILFFVTLLELMFFFIPSYLALESTVSYFSSSEHLKQRTSQFFGQLCIYTLFTFDLSLCPW